MIWPGVAIGVAVAVVTGWGVTAALWPWRGWRLSAGALQFGVALVIGQSLHGLGQFAVLGIAPASGAAFVAVEVVLPAAALALWWTVQRQRRRRARARHDDAGRADSPREEGLAWPASPPPGIIGRIVLLAAGLAVTLVLLGIEHDLRRAPHGQYDGWAMWNYKARLLHRGGEDWQKVFADGTPHPDYPLGQPLSVMRLWRYEGVETAAGRAAPAVLAAVGVMLILGAGVGLLRRTVLGCAAVLVLVSVPFFAEHAASLYADTAAGLGALAALVLLAAIHETGAGQRRGAWVLAGLAAGAAAWTKLDGQLFAFALVVTVLVGGWIAAGRRGALRSTGWLLVGLAPALLAAAVVHVCAPAGTGLAGSPADLDRHATIWHALYHQLPALVNPWALFLVWLLWFGGGAVRRRRGWGSVAMIAAVIALFSAGSYAAFLLKHQDLNWHLQTALNRVFIQLWPALVLLAFLLARGPGAASSGSGRSISPACASTN